MPKSKSKRNTYRPPPKPNPKPAPRWVPVLFFTFLGVGFAIILLRYILSSSVPFFDNNLILGLGLALVAGAFGVATQWR